MSGYHIPPPSPPPALVAPPLNRCRLIIEVNDESFAARPITVPSNPDLRAYRLRPLDGSPTFVVRQHVMGVACSHPNCPNHRALDLNAACLHTRALIVAGMVEMGI